MKYMEILVVEDDPSTSLMIEHGLKQMGFKAEVVDSARTAWRSLQSKHFDVIISDWLMPDMDGLELCRAIRERFERELRTPYIYFLVLTSLTSRESRLEAIRAGVDDYLTKPLDRHDLLLRLIVAQRVTRLHRRLEVQAEESERLNRELHEAVRRDPLTGVGNRHRLDEDIATLCSAPDRPSGRRLVVALVDVDLFKDFNDTYLHVRGDEALRHVALALESAGNGLSADGCGSMYGLYRFGGEEFVAIFEIHGHEGLVAIGNAMRIAVESLGLEHRNNPTGVVTVSVGVAAVAQPMDAGVGVERVQQAIRAADGALFGAKHGGRNRVVAAPEDGPV